MSRVDTPTLRCDRCGVTTTDLNEMARFERVVHEHMSGRTSWDLCPPCWADFQDFLADM